MKKVRFVKEFCKRVNFDNTKILNFILWCLVSDKILSWEPFYVLKAANDRDQRI